ncbi:MAG TPA: hydrogenase nickel incorporation protein HypB [Kineosporiaceae bacterium]|nr:hydrogenase nickel incorporation protein HypB [Kineosporiaceae bacterium]
MGRFHRHDDGTVHEHDHGAHEHGDGHEHGSHDHGSHDHGSHDGGPVPHPAATGAAADSLIGDHSGYDTGAERIEVLEAIFGENDRLAAANRADFDAAGVRVLNLMSSPGAGKTELLRRTLERLGGRVRIGIVEGDIETSLDADRLEGFGAQIALVNTGKGFGGECHLDAPMVRSALPRLALPALDLLLVENVGNLVCPAEFSVGEHARAMVYAVTEGEEKPLKYPVMFRSVDLVVINKVDLLPYLDFDLDLFLRNLRTVNPGAVTLQLSARTGEGVDAWCDWVTAQAGRPAPA